MAYEVLARKWRPQRFEDVVGQDHVVQTLKNAIESKRLAHAYLFVGSRGIGKTSIARIFARALNCQTGPTTTPCGTCDSCREIAGGTNLDVLEIDGASNNNVDQVRELRDTIRYAPTRGPFKIYIIDEVHMLSNSAFNALLKTLEEPPAHAKFFFATTEPQKIPATVLSRCQRFDLRRISTAEIVQRLREMGLAEKVTIADDALLAIARGAEGGMRDAQSALDQLISFRGSTIAEEDVLAVFGLVARASLEGLADAVLAGDLPALIRLVSELDGSGKDLQRLVVELMEHFRNLLITLNVDDPAAHGDLTDAQLEVLRRQATRVDTAKALRIVQVLAEAEDRMKYALSRRTLLETALIRCARAATVVSLEEILSQIQALRASLGGDAASAAGAPSPPPAPLATPPAPAPARLVRESSAPPPAAPSAPPAGTAGSSSRPMETAVPAVIRAVLPPATEPADHAAELAQLIAGWPALKERVGKQAVLTKAILADARPLAVSDLHVSIGFDDEFPDEMQRFEGGRDRKALELALSTMLKRKVTATFSLVSNEPALRESTPAPTIKPADKPVEVPIVNAKPPATAAPSAPGRKAKSTQEWTKEETARRTLEMFNGSIIDVRE